MKILFLSFTCKDTGVVMVTNMISQLQESVPFCLKFNSVQSKTRSSFLKNNLAYMILGANGDCTCGSCDLNIVNKQDITDLKYLLRRGGDSSFRAELFVLISHNANFELPPAQFKPSTVGTIYVVNSLPIKTLF